MKVKKEILINFFSFHLKFSKLESNHLFAFSSQEELLLAGYIFHDTPSPSVLVRVLSSSFGLLNFFYIFLIVGTPTVLSIFKVWSHKRAI